MPILCANLSAASKTESGIDIAVFMILWYNHSYTLSRGKVITTCLTVSQAKLYLKGCSLNNWSGGFMFLFKFNNPITSH